MIELIETDCPELGIKFQEVKCGEPGILNYVLEQLEAERLGLDI